MAFSFVSNGRLQSHFRCNFISRTIYNKKHTAASCACRAQLSKRPPSALFLVQQLLGIDNKNVPLCMRVCMYRYMYTYTYICKHFYCADSDETCLRIPERHAGGGYFSGLIHASDLMRPHKMPGFDLLDATPVSKLLKPTYAEQQKDKKCRETVSAHLNSLTELN